MEPYIYMQRKFYPISLEAYSTRDLIVFWKKHILRQSLSFLPNAMNFVQHDGGISFRFLPNM